MNNMPKTVILLLFILMTLLPWRNSAAAEAKKDMTAKPGDCVACHGTAKVLPDGHPDTVSMTLNDCRACHEKSGDNSLRTKMPLFHLHQLSGTTCAKCHADPSKAEDVPASRCMECHDVNKVAAATAQVKQQNPHVSKHYGNKADCNLCHHAHEKSENYCSTCHNFQFMVP